MDDEIHLNAIESPANISVACWSPPGHEDDLAYVLYIVTCSAIGLLVAALTKLFGW